MAVVILALPCGCGGGGSSGGEDPGGGSPGVVLPDATLLISGPTQRKADDVAVFDDGSMLLGGEFVTEIVLGAGEPNETTLTSTGSWAVVLARFAADGALLWAETAQTSDGNGVSLAALPDLSCLVAGTMMGNVTFGAGQVGETIIDTGGDRWSYIARYASDGTLLWVKTAIDAFADDVAAFSDGSFVICGDVRSGAIFGPGEPGETVLTTISPKDLFVARYAADGTFLGVSHAGGGAPSNNHWAFSVATVPDGSCVTTGYIRDGCIFGQGEPNETTLTVPGTVVNPFVARYAADGSLLWARRAECATFASAPGIAAWSDGSCAITGRLTTQPVTFGPGETGETTLTSNGQFVARYAPTGDLVWAKAVQSASPFDQMSGIAALHDNTALLVGTANGDALAGAGEPNETLVQVGASAFVARYQADGSLAWARGDPMYAWAGAVTPAPGGYAWCGRGHSFNNDLTFDNGTIYPAEPGNQFLFVARRADD